MSGRRLYTTVCVSIFTCGISLACGGEGGSSGGEGGSNAARSVAGNCDLLTDEEVSALAGFELAHGDDSPLGCPYTRPGELTGRVVVGFTEATGDAASIAAQGYPNAETVVSVDGVGEDTVAVSTPTGDTVAAILTVGGGNVVELGVFMLGIEPDETDAIHEAAELAVLALERSRGR